MQNYLQYFLKVLQGMSLQKMFLVLLSIAVLCIVLIKKE